MVQLWYPATHARGRAWPWLTASEVVPVGKDLAQTVGAEPRIIPGLDHVVTSGRHNAPMTGRRADLPVVVFSPGFGAQRNSSSAVVTDLASHGYLVVTVDHTHDATVVEFPGGRIEPNTLLPLLAGIEDPDEFITLATRMTEVRAADLRFVLDELGTRHLAFHDTVVLAPALPRITEATPALVAEAYGVIDGRRVVAVTRAYVRAFFDLHLRRRRSPLLDGPSRRYPDVTFVPHGTQQTETFSLLRPK